MICPYAQECRLFNPLSALCCKTAGNYAFKPYSCKIEFEIGKHRKKGRTCIVRHLEKELGGIEK